MLPWRPWQLIILERRLPNAQLHSFGCAATEHMSVHGHCCQRRSSPLIRPPHSPVLLAIVIWSYFDQSAISSSLLGMFLLSFRPITSSSEATVVVLLFHQINVSVIRADRPAEPRDNPHRGTRMLASVKTTLAPTHTHTRQPNKHPSTCVNTHTHMCTCGHTRKSSLSPTPLLPELSHPSKTKWLL